MGYMEDWQNLTGESTQSVSPMQNQHRKGQTETNANYLNPQYGLREIALGLSERGVL